MTATSDSDQSITSETTKLTLPRIAIILNEKVDFGRLLNAAAHLALGFGAAADQPTRLALRLQNYADASGDSHANISALSLVVLKANGNQLRTLKGRVAAAGLQTVDFLETMTGGTYAEQLERTRASSPDDLEYLGILVFGTREELDPLTRKFSLFRG